MEQNLIGFGCIQFPNDKIFSHSEMTGDSIEGNFRKARLLERQEKGSLGRRQHKSEGGGGGGGKSKKMGKGFVVVSEQCRVGEKILELSEFRATLNRDVGLSLR